MKILVVEDELHNSRMLIGMVNQLRPNWEILETCESVKQSVDWLNKNPHPDLIFMDIQLTDGVCFSIFEQVELNSSIIFTTAYDEYAIQAFKVNSIDYLLKPLKESHLKIAIEKFEKFHHAPEEQSPKPDYQQLLDAIGMGVKKFRKRFVINKTTSFVPLNVEDVAYFQIDQRVVTAFTFDGKGHHVDVTMDKLEEELDPDQFFRANRGVIVNSEAIKKFENYFGGKIVVILAPPFTATITISRLKATAFKHWLDK